MIKKETFTVSDRHMPWVVLFLLSLIGFAVFKDYLLFQKVYFFKGVASDSYNGIYPFLYNNAGYIAKNGLPKWSFYEGMGQNTFPFILHDPFDIALYIVGQKHIYFAMVYKELAKVLFSGLIFYYYLRAVRLSAYASLAGSLSYAFCGFMIIGGCWSWGHPALRRVVAFRQANKKIFIPSSKKPA